MSLALGLLTVAWPLAWAPAWTYLLAGLGLGAVLASLQARWERAPAVATVAAIIVCTFARASVGVLAAEGFFILGYLLAVSAPAGRPAPWLRRQGALLTGGLIVGGAALAAFALPRSVSPWLTAAGLAAAATAYLIVLPPRRARPHG